MKPITPLLTVDAIIQFNGKIVFIKRKNPPFQGQYALPGGFVDIGETVEQAVIREAEEETGLKIIIIKLVGIYSDPERDPRGHTVSITYLANGYGTLRSGSDAATVELLKLDELPDLAFDHVKMIHDAFSE